MSQLVNYLIFLKRSYNFLQFFPLISSEFFQNFLNHSNFWKVFSQFLLNTFNFSLHFFKISKFPQNFPYVSSKSTLVFLKVCNNGYSEFSRFFFIMSSKSVHISLKSGILLFSKISVQPRKLAWKFFNISYDFSWKFLKISLFPLICSNFSKFFSSSLKIF